MRLKTELLTTVAAGGVSVPQYDRNDVQVGIVHFGPSNFFRAHLAVYIDDLLNAGNRDLGISVVSLRRAEVRDALAPQDNLYTVVEQDGETDRSRVIGSIKEIIYAAEDKKLVVERLADPNVKLVTMTITQAGYYYKASNTGLDNSSLDVDDAEVQYSLDHYDDPTITAGYLVLGLEERMQRGLGGLTVVSCDNLTNNGTILSQTVDAYARRRDPVLANWIKNNVAFPNTMVDRIVPKTDIRKMQAFSSMERHGYHDAWPVFTEPFRQFVIGQRDNPALQPLREAGAVLTDNVRPYEDMKIGTLNGLHFALGTLGRHAGYKYVDQAIADPELRLFAQRFMAEVAATLDDVPGIDMDDYHIQIFKRLENPHMGDELIRLARNGTDKVVQRTIDPLQKAIGRGTPHDALMLSLASWMVYLKRGGQDENFDISDKKAFDMRLPQTAASMNGNPSILLANQDFQRFLGALAREDQFMSDLARMYAGLVHQMEASDADMAVDERQAVRLRLEDPNFDV